MADELSIPGVTDKYKTNDLVNALMEVEKKPLYREQEQVEKYKTQQDAWRGVNQKISSLKESAKTLYSFENPFNNKLTESTDERAVTADADRDAEYGSFKIDVEKEATTDRFLSGNIDKDLKVEPGKYIYGVGSKTIEFNWKGGKITDFVKALNRRGTDLIKASLIGISSSKKSLLIEGLKTGNENKLVFKEQALAFAKQIDMVSDAKNDTKALAASASDFLVPSTNDAQAQENMPALSKDNVTSDGNTITIPARGGVEIPIPAGLNENGHQRLEFTFKASEVQDITQGLNDALSNPVLPDPGTVSYGGITLVNDQSETALEAQKALSLENLEPVTDNQFIFLKNKDGSETQIDISALPRNPETGEVTVAISLDEYPDAESLIIRNANTGKEVTMSMPQSYDASKNQGFAPNHAVSTAEDAIIKYEGITLTRPSNDIDDVVPNLTLHIHGKTDKTATITVNPDTESAKNALITFVGKYNQVMSELNILTTRKPEIIAELDYLTEEEQEAATKKLGMFQGDFTLTNGRTSFQRIVSSNYNYADTAEVTMLSQIGISTNASRGTSGYNASQMRGYLEVDEKKLDAMLKTNLDDVKHLFGYDSDGDMIVDDGIGYQLDKQSSSWTQVGGILATKISSLDTQIENSNKKISKLETQLDEKEANLKQKYANMEGTVNSLDSQRKSLSNFANQGNNRN